MTVNIRQLATTANDFEAEFQRVLHWSAETDHAIEERVASILADVRARGDAALLEYTARFDGVHAASKSTEVVASWRMPTLMPGPPPPPRTHR